MLVLPVVQAVVVGQGHVHIRRIADIGVVHPPPLGHRMEDAGVFSPGLLRFVQAHQQQGQEGHVVAQSQPGALSRLAANPPADAAIHGAVALLLLFRQFLPAGGDIAKHGQTLLFPLDKSGFSRFFFLS